MGYSSPDASSRHAADCGPSNSIPLLSSHCGAPARKQDKNNPRKQLINPHFLLLLNLIVGHLLAANA